MNALSNMLVVICSLFLLALSIAVPAKEVFQLTEVPFYDQKQNKEQGWRACNITSVAMVLDYFVITPKDKVQARTPDYLFNKFGIKQDPFELQAMFNMVARDAGSPIRDVFYEYGTIAQLRELASKGVPTIIHGWFTDSGHILVVTGFDGENYIVNDPYGKWLGQKWQKSSIAYDTSVSGQGLRYPAKVFELAINDNAKGNDLWLHTFKNSTTKQL